MTLNSLNKVEFTLNGSLIPNSKGSIYLGIPLGENKFLFEYFEDEFKSVERSLYSLKGLGYFYNGASLRTITFINKQYCQSIVKFGLENIYLSAKQLNQLNNKLNNQDK